MKPQRSEPGLDVLRGLLVIGMFAVHARRLQSTASRAGTLGDRALDAFMWAEPFIAAGFLFVVGVSLVLSQSVFVERGSGSWTKKLVVRAAGIHALAILLFVPQYGIELPDLLVSPGILSAIAIAIVAVGVALGSEQRLAWLSTIALAGVLVTVGLDRAEISIAGINAGPGGALPLVSICAAGAIVMLLRRRHGRAALALLALVPLPALAAAIATDAEWTTLRASYYAEHSGLLALPDLFREPASRAAVVFWNHSALGALALLSPLGVCLLAALHAPRPLLESRALEPVALLGRHALSAYVAHLGLLGLVELAGLGPVSALGTWSLIGALVALTGAFAFALERRRQSVPASAGAAAAQTRTS